jgi:hypothetical protein
MTSFRAIRTLALTLTVAAGVSCAGSSASSPGSNTGEGGGGGGCQTSACVGGLKTPVKWAIEIDPSGTGSAALTELTDVAIGGEPQVPLTLTADSIGAVVAAFSAAPGGTVPSTANVVLSMAPLIGGRPDLTFQAPATFGSSGGASATLNVPASAVAMGGAPGRSGTLQLVPLSPADQQSPPASFSVTVAALLSEMLPTNLVPMTGTLLNAINAPPSATFVARAFLSGTQISNAPQTDSSGSFQLLLAPEPAGSLVTIELTPLNQDGADPWYTSSPLDPTMNRILAPIMLPPYSSPNVFSLPVQDQADPTVGVVGALVRAQAILLSSAAGATDFLATGTTVPATSTSIAGTVTLSLLPGGTHALLDYDLTVIPPASSAYATHCVSPVGVQTGGTADAPSSLMPIGLSKRPVLTGSVTDASGRPVPNVAITATAGPEPTDVCTDTPAVSSSTVADVNGMFSFPLDPGTYQLDYDPPAGAPVPRLTEPAFTIPATGVVQLTHDVALPVAALVKGAVLGPDGVGLPSATVRIFRVLCTGQDDCFGPTRTPPELLAQTISDGNGNFQAVVNANAPSD